MGRISCHGEPLQQGRAADKITPAAQDASVCEDQECFKGGQTASFLCLHKASVQLVCRPVQQGVPGSSGDLFLGASSGGKPAHSFLAGNFLTREIKCQPRLVFHILASDQR